MVNNLLGIIVDYKDFDFQLESIQRIADFGEVNVDFIDLFDFLKIDGWLVVPRIYCLKIVCVVELGFRVLNDWCLVLLLDVVWVDKSVIVPAEQRWL